MLLDNEYPYLEPLWKWLREDEILKQEFTEKSFFMPHDNLIAATQEAMTKNCPAPRALWILPQDTLASVRLEGCRSPGVHTFYITIMVQCIREAFEPVKRENELRLGGQFMELVALRKYVKQSTLNFFNDYRKNGGKKFEKFSWVKDQMLYPDGEDNKFLTTASQFEITIF